MALPWDFGPLPIIELAEGVGFEPTLGLLLSLISSQVPSTTQPPFRTNVLKVRCAVFLTNILCVRLYRGQAHSQCRRAATRPRFRANSCRSFRHKHFFSLCRGSRGSGKCRIGLPWTLTLPK